MTPSDKIDRIVTNRWLALPIFAVVMFLVYYISVSTVGGWATDWANDGVFGEGWHLFGIGTSAYESAVEEYNRADQIIAASEDGHTTAEIQDEEGNVIETVNLTDAIVNEAQRIVETDEPDAAD